MKNKKLLESIPLIYKNATCPARNGGKAIEAAQTAVDIIRSNCDASFSHEIDAFEGTLCIWWKHEVAWRDITLPCRTLLEMHGITPKNPRFDHSIMSVAVNMYYEIPMFERNEKENEPAYENPIRQDFAKQIETFIKRFKFLSEEANGLVFTPLRNHLCNQVKNTHRRIVT